MEAFGGLGQDPKNMCGVAKGLAFMSVQGFICEMNSGERAQHSDGR